MLVILSEAKDPAIKRNACNQLGGHASVMFTCLDPTVRSLGPSRTGIVCATRDDESKTYDCEMTKLFYVYMVTNRSRVVLYTGITNDLTRRVWEHQNAEVKGFTKTYNANRLVYYEIFEDPLNAITREKEIKGWRRSKKNALVERLNPKWSDLSSVLFQPSRDSSSPPRQQKAT